MTASSAVFGQRPEFERGGESGRGRPQAAREPAKGGSHRTPGGCRGMRGFPKLVGTCSDLRAGIPHEFQWHNICSEELVEVEVFQL